MININKCYYSDDKACVSILFTDVTSKDSMHKMYDNTNGNELETGPLPFWE